MDTAKDSRYSDVAQNRIFSDLSFLFFYIFFICEILSPKFFNLTIYLYSLAIILNFIFLKKCWDKLLELNLIGWILLLILFFLQPFTTTKILITLVTALYIDYSCSKKSFYLFKILNFSVLFAALQFAVIVYDDDYRNIFGPDAIAQYIWGANATDTFSNFDTIIGFLNIPRVSGFSREPGFFAALIVVCVLLLLEMKGKSITKLFVMLGYFLSISKVSILLPVIGLLRGFRVRIDRSNPYSLCFFALVALASLTWVGSDYILDPLNETFFHRFGAFLAWDQLSISQMLLGVNKLEEIPEAYELFNNRHFNNDKLVGLAGFILNNGLVYFTLFLIFLRKNYVTTYGILVLMLITLTTSFDTNVNFVILGYFLVFKFYTNRHEDNIHKR